MSSTPTTAKSRGQLAYEEDVRRCPVYEDGTPRKPWSKLPDYAKDSWQRKPYPRNHKRKGVAA